jgi:hypothetical protein
VALEGDASAVLTRIFHQPHDLAAEICQTC